MFLILLPFLGSGFVPVDSMPAGLRWFAENQPFTPITNTVRSLLADQHIGSAGVKAIVWCVAITPPPAICGLGISTTADPSGRRHPVNPAGTTASHFCRTPGKYRADPKQVMRGSNANLGPPVQGSG